MRRLTALACFAILLAAALPVRAAEQAEKEKSSDNATFAEVQKTIAAIEETFNRGDAKALAALWATEGEFVGAGGETVVGRESIEKVFQAFFAENKNCKLRLAVVAARPVADDVVLVDAATHMTPAPKNVTGTPRSTILLVRRDGRWLIDSVREIVGNVPSHFQQIKELAWMAGDWATADADKSKVSIRSSCDWTANGSFLIRKFSIDRKGGASVGGTEIIGYDPRLHRIRSWVFESDGGFGESEWTRDGKQWVVHYEGTLADGGDIAATHVMTLDADTITVESIDRTIDGERAPDMGEITFRRSPPPEKKTEPAQPPRHVLP